VKAFSSVGGGVKGKSRELEGGVIFRCSCKGVCDVDMAVFHVISSSTDNGSRRELVKFGVSARFS
jgi:hypothetical protein